MNILIVLLFASLVTISVQQSTDSPQPVDVDIDSAADLNEESQEGLPSSDVEQVAYYLYPDPENLTYHEEIKLGDNDSLIESSYSPFKPVIFIIHGFISNYTSKFSQRVKDAFLENGYGAQWNFIVVDWGALSTPNNSSNLEITPMTDLSKNPHYLRAVKNVPKVGKRTAQFIDFLMMESYLESPSDVYLVGFSLGAQIAGTCGYEVQQSMAMSVGRVTGLDPAGPLYQSETNSALKLDASDGDFVDIIHTNQGQNGYEGNIGHADFYPNGGGPNQNDCLTAGVEVVEEYGIGLCAHGRAWVYYIIALMEEVYACKCYATPDYYCKSTCTTKVLFGYPCPPTTRGTFYVDITVKEERDPGAGRCV